MNKIITSLAFFTALTLPALAAPSVAAPEIGTSVLGFALASGVAYLLNRRASK